MIKLSHRALGQAFFVGAAMLLAAGCAEQPPAPAATAAAPAAAPDSVVASKSKMQCQSDAATGSMIRRNTICVPDDQVGDVQRNTQETIRSYTQRQ